MISDERFYSANYALSFQRDIWEGRLRSTTVHYPLSRRDPIFTPLFTSFFTAIGFGATTAGVLGSLTTALVTTAITVGIQAAMAPKPPKPEDGKAPMTQSVPPRHWVIGTTRMAGAYMLWEALGAALYAVQGIAGHPVHSYNRFYLHDDEVALDESGYVQALEDGRYGSDLVQLLFRLGANPETPYAPMVSAFASSGIWTNNHRGDGQASIAMKAFTPKAKDFSTIFPFNIPRLTVEVSGAHVWDFRDPDQDPDLPATWGFSKNPALQLAWHWCFSEFGHRRDYRKAILPVLDMWIEEADVCDELVTITGGGVEKRYECSGWDTTEREPKVGTNAILAACDGWLCERGDGALLFTAGKFRESRVVTLGDEDIVGHRIQYDVLFEEEINRLVPKFNYPDVGYSTSDTDFFEDEDRQLLAGRVLAEDANYQWVTNWRQARRLGWREWQRILQKVRGSLNVRLSGINGVYSRWIRLATPNRLPRLDGKVIENRRAVLDLMRGGFSLEVIQHPDNIDQWSTALEGQKPAAPAKPNSANMPTPVISSAVAVAAAGSVYLNVSLVDPSDNSLTPAIRYRIQDTGGGHPGAWVEKTIVNVDASEGFIVCATDVVPGDRWLDVQAAFISARGKYSDWSATEAVFSTVNPTAPPAVTIGAVITGVPGEVTINWTAPNSSLYASARVYYNTVNNPATATFNSPALAGAPNGSYSRTITRPAGTYYGWVASVNASGVEGTRTPTGAFTVT
ncbi:hypothetical protein [Rhizobium lentis]|uniref:Fibronectin type-III domain-containing protein n=1 Tax=Rhizobium lentis TaxID=1138194 RepID=A0A7W8UME9_9HYPH|nr:hypothetical protein [Rhizobium lentis]MBB4574382.1 hypothetical protein [Rhizobium lentis]MBB5550308.1 hypothetical protein [Rhizobium lentis]MBB5560663.1 hypothetical protein [Rhizobium lentis]MBB5567248.1 hypothetical protein [Rhizobium lentis]